MERALAYLQRIHESVIKVSDDGTDNPMEIAKRTAPLLGLSPLAVNPLLARTLAANLRIRDDRNLTVGT
jgi:hydroxyacylglutathione hydrolase